MYGLEYLGICFRRRGLHLSLPANSSPCLPLTTSHPLLVIMSILGSHHTPACELMPEA